MSDITITREQWDMLLSEFASLSREVTELPTLAAAETIEHHVANVDMVLGKIAQQNNPSRGCDAKGLPLDPDHHWWKEGQ